MRVDLVHVPFNILKMKKWIKNLVLLFSALSLWADGEVNSVLDTNGKDMGAAIRPKQTSKAIPTDDIVMGLKDDDVFLRIEDYDVLTWGVFRKHLDALETDTGPSKIQASIKSATYRGRFRKLLQDYVQYGVIAAAARKAGITIPDEQFVKYRAMARAQYQQQGAVGKRLISLMDSPESFYEHNLTNALLWLEYRNKVIAPKVRVEDEAITNLVAVRHEANLRRMATNAVKRALLKDIWKKVKGGMDFAVAAKKWSECESADSGGLLMSDDDDNKTARFEVDDLHPALAAACWGLKEGEISDVAETPYAWHVLKVMKRYPATEDLEETVELAHIMLEKEMLKPEYDKAGARTEIWQRTLKAGTGAEFVELYKQTRLECKIPIMDETPTEKPKLPALAK